MKFSRRKLPQEALASLRKVQVSDCEPHAILLTPIYVYLLQNQKFVAVKGPLAFFDQVELDKYKSFENFYLPEFVDQISPFQKAGRVVRDLLLTRQTFHLKAHSGGKVSIVMPLPQYELDDAVLRAIGPLWEKGVSVEPFFLCVLMEEVCEPMPAEILGAAAEKNTELFELALLRASSAVFLALHVGYCEPAVLQNIRDAAFESTMGESLEGRPNLYAHDELSQLIPLVRAAIPSTETRTISIQRFIELLKNPGTSGRNAHKLIARLNRVEAELISPQAAVLSIYGEKGLLDE